MKEITKFQYSVVPGEKVILQTKISGNAIVKVAAPMVQTASNTWEFTMPAQNVVVPVLVTFPDQTPTSQVDLTVDGELNGHRGEGPFAVFPILPQSALKDPEFQFFVN